MERSSRILPDEIIAEIILHLPMMDILGCRTVSKHINNLIEASSVIQYKIELSANGLVPCTESPLSAAMSVRRLREQQQAWRRCEWTGEHIIKLESGCRTYELRNGIWAFGQASENALPDFTTTITCFKLPSAASSSEDGTKSGDRWDLKDLGMSIRDFTMDPLMDLLVLVEQTPDGKRSPFCIHIRRLSDGQPHELAAEPVLHISMASSNRGACAFGVQLQGSFIGVLVRQDGELGDYDYLGVWNWRTGTQVMNMRGMTCSFDDFAFIDAQSIMIAVIEHPVTLQVWRFDKSGVKYVGGFALPLTTTENAYLEMHFDGGPSASPAGAKNLDGTPFTSAPIPEILAISFGVIETDTDPQAAEVASFTMVMQLSLMFEALGRRDDLDKSRLLSCEPNGMKVLHWENWGPECTRWIPQDPVHWSWEPCAVGGRLVIVTPLIPSDAEEDTPSPEYQAIRLYDFRPGIVSRYRSCFPEDIFCTESSVVPKESMFVEDIISSLPYHVVTSKDLPCSVSGVMIDEGRLICTKAEVDKEWRALLVLTF